MSKREPLTLAQISLLIQIHRGDPRLLEDHDGEGPSVADLRCLEDRGFILTSTSTSEYSEPTENGRRLIESIRALSAVD